MFVIREAGLNPELSCRAAKPDIGAGKENQEFYGQDKRNEYI